MGKGRARGLPLCVLVAPVPQAGQNDLSRDGSGRRRTPPTYGAGRGRLFWAAAILFIISIISFNFLSLVVCVCVCPSRNIGHGRDQDSYFFSRLQAVFCWDIPARTTFNPPDRHNRRPSSCSVKSKGGWVPLVCATRQAEKATLVPSPPLRSRVRSAAESSTLPCDAVQNLVRVGRGGGGEVKICQFNAGSGNRGAGCA